MAASEKKIKISIARKISRFVMLLLVTAMVILFVGTYQLVSGIVMNEITQYSETLLNIYSDLLGTYSHDAEIGLGVENGEELIRISDLFCDRFDVDYVYLYSVELEEKTVTYSVASFSAAKKHLDPSNHMIGRIANYELSPEELAVWNGETECYTYSLDNFYGYEITTIKLVQDCDGKSFIAGIDLNHEQVYNKIRNVYFLVIAGITVLILSIGLAIYFFTRKIVSKPARKISQTMQDYISEGSRSDVRLDDSGTDEYAVIAGAFNSMTDDISQYIDNIQTLSSQHASQQAELEIAERIQRGLLRNPTAEFGTASLRAVMDPAKNIGGDLYDYMELDEHRLFVVIADVSGKGVSAAMFMSVTLTLLRQFAKLGLAPDEILRQTNNALCENNSELLFATAFVGIYDSSSGTFTYSNAGHNLPYRIGDSVSVLDGASGTVLGLYEDEPYENCTVEVLPGDTVFLYTDGVTEAVNLRLEFFGDGRLEKLLSGFRGSGEPDLVKYVYRTVRDFSGETEQYDDITMLALHFTGDASRGKKTLLLDFQVSEFVRIKEVILALPIAHETRLNLCLAAEEVFVNICDYAFADGAPEGEKILFTLEYGEEIVLRFADGGMPFDPLQDVEGPKDEEEPEIGGLGRFLYVSLCDEAKYEYKDGKNILILIKKNTEEPS